MSTTLPLDLLHPDRNWAAWADYGCLIYPQTDRPRTGETCRSCITIYDTCVLWTLGDNLQSFLAGVGFATGTAATGALTMSVKIPCCFFAMSFRKKSRHLVKRSLRALLACQSPDLWVTGRRVRAFAWMAAHCPAVLRFHPGILSCSILCLIAFRQALSPGL